MGTVVRHMTEEGRVGDIGRGVWGSRLCPPGNSEAGMAARWRFLLVSKPNLVLFLAGS